MTDFKDKIIDAIVYILASIACFELFAIPCMGSLPNNIDIPKIVEEAPIREHLYIQSEPFKIEDPGYSVEEMKLIALIMVAEAEGESDYGKRLVIDTILNRADSLYFPDTIEEVIYQQNQFSCTTNGRLDRVKIDGDDYALVVEEARNRSNNEVLYFTAGGYGMYGTPLFSEGNHYFCSQ